MNKELLAEFESYLHQSLMELPAGKLRDAMEYSLMAGGKRVRPSLLFAALESYGMDPKEGFACGAAIEMVHTYSLIHDDLPAMDDDDLRRGRPSCHKAFDEATAILAGDALLTHAFYMMASCSSDPARAMECTKALSWYSGAAGMVYGQMLDLQAEDKEATKEQLEAIEQYKTGCLIQLPLVCAAILAGHPEHIDTWKEAGRLCGIQFQMRDDFLEKTRSAADLGKSTSDVRNEKATALSVYNLKELEAQMEALEGQMIDTVSSLNLESGSLEALLHDLSVRQK